MTGLPARSPGLPAGPARPRVLAVAGTDPSGAAGLHADLRALFATGVHGMGVVSSVTAQNSVAVRGIWALPAAAVRGQLDAVLGDVRVDAVKTGMLAAAETVAVVAEVLAAAVATGTPLVVDPVATASTGRSLIEPAAVTALVTDLLPLATVVTPNLDEVHRLTGVPVGGVPVGEVPVGGAQHARLTDLRRAADAVLALGPRWVLIKGGHLPAGEDALDLLSDGVSTVELRAARLPARHTRGTGCTLASALAAFLAHGLDVPAAARAAKAYVIGAIAGGYEIGAGPGPVDQGWQWVG
ncbi:MAG: bifunctional hydroxymethylpyrimidine kinase/phosphomethylpyrimidine kinase [Frankiaceae bacterium]